MFKDSRVKIAFATGNGTHVDVGFEQATQIATYEISLTEAHELRLMTYRAATEQATALEGGPGKRGGCGGGGKGKGGGGGCGGGKGKKAGGCADAKPEDEVNKQDIIEKVASLDDVSVLFINKTLNAYSVIELGQSRVFSIKVDGTKEIAEIISRIQEMLAGEPPLWLRRHLIGAEVAVEQ
ncbi:MAG: hypothetical protein P4K80_08135 [Acidobacteriaceae bacterium]|nr:hypothetical protein [Acidobacteriaceae bacterium]